MALLRQHRETVSNRPATTMISQAMALPPAGGKTDGMRMRAASSPAMTPATSSSLASQGSAGAETPTSARTVTPGEPSGFITTTVQSPARAVQRSVWLSVPHQPAEQAPSAMQPNCVADQGVAASGVRGGPGGQVATLLLVICPRHGPATAEHDDRRQGQDRARDQRYDTSYRPAGPFARPVRRGRRPGRGRHTGRPGRR